MKNFLIGLTAASLLVGSVLLLVWFLNVSREQVCANRWKDSNVEYRYVKGGCLVNVPEFGWVPEEFYLNRGYKNGA